MSDETLYDLRCYVSNCFNHRGYMYNSDVRDESGYQQLSRLMIEEYNLDDFDVDNIVGDIEELVAKFIMNESPKFTDNDE